MKLRCERFVLRYLPTIRAFLAKNLVERYNLSQTQVARKLGISQAAVSLYVKGKRGSKFKCHLVNNKHVCAMLERLVEIVIMKDMNAEEACQILCQLCKILNKLDEE